MDNLEKNNENILRIHMTEKRYADDFINYGRIKFSTPQSWVNYVDEHGNGRGDVYEGTLAFCDIQDIDKICELDNKYSYNNFGDNHPRPLTKILYKNRVLYKDKRSMRLPCYCIYVLKNADLLPSIKGSKIYEAFIDGSYFKDFTDNRTKNQIESLLKEEQPALIIIQDFKKFKQRMIKAFNKIGIEDKNVLIQYSAYFDFERYGWDGWYDFQQKYPKELFIKNLRFKNQSEGRIVINTTDTRILKRLEKPVDLGCMEDIAKVLYGYFPDGIRVEISALDIDICNEK